MELSWSSKLHMAQRREALGDRVGGSQEVKWVV